LTISAIRLVIIIYYLSILRLYLLKGKRKNE
jgi:hypothetical protein